MKIAASLQPDGSTMTYDDTSAPTCDVCGKPMPDTAYVCTRCSDKLAGHLTAVVDLAGEVETTVARLSRHGDSGGRRLSEVDDDTARPTGGLRVGTLPFNPAARRAGDEAINAVTTWARHVIDERGLPATPRVAPFGPLCGSQGVCRHGSCAVIDGRWSEHPAATAARLVVRHLGWLRHRPEAGEAWQDLTGAALMIVRVVDRPADLAYAGPCWEPTEDGQCPEELYGYAGAGTVRCRRCGARHDMAERRAWLLDEVDDALAYAAQIAGALTALDRPVTSSQVRNLAARGRIAERGRDERGRPLYRVGEVRLVLADVARRVVTLVA